MHTTHATPGPDAAFWASFHEAEREADAAVLGLSGAELDAQDRAAREATSTEFLLGRAREALRLADPGA